jgi:cellulose biosynthesis protein BcsQ
MEAETTATLSFAPGASRCSTAPPRGAGGQAKIIAVFNYKGGVGKSTISTNLSATFARAGHKTLLVDCDPQCNTTTFFLPPAMNPYRDPHEDEAGAPAPGGPQAPPAIRQDYMRAEVRMNQAMDLNIIFQGNPFGPGVSDLFTALSPAFLGNAGGMVAPPVYALPDVPNLYLLPGSPSVFRFEQQLGFMDAMDAVPRSYYAGALSHMLQQLAARDGYEFIILDCSPSSGVINKICVMSSDFILPPCFADFYSLSSVHGLLFNVLPVWLRWRATVVAEQASIPEIQAAFKLKPHPPRILPFMVGNYNLSYAGLPPLVPGVQPDGYAFVVNSFAVFIKTLRQLLQHAEIPPICSDLFVPDNGEMVITFMPHLGSISKVSHQFGHPVVCMTAQLLVNMFHVTPQQADEMMHSANRAIPRFNQLAQFIVNHQHDE